MFNFNRFFQKVTPTKEDCLRVAPVNSPARQFPFVILSNAKIVKKKNYIAENYGLRYGIRKINDGGDGG